MRLKHTLDVDEVRFAYDTAGMSGLVASSGGGSGVYENDPLTGNRYWGVWVKEGQPGPPNTKRHNRISQSRRGWWFYFDTRFLPEQLIQQGVSTEGIPDAVTPAFTSRISVPVSTPAELVEQPEEAMPSRERLLTDTRVGRPAHEVYYADEPATTGQLVTHETTRVHVLSGEAEAMAQQWYLGALRDYSQVLQLIEAAYYMGTVPPPIPERPARPDNLTHLGVHEQEIRRLEQEIDELLIVRIPYAVREYDATKTVQSLPSLLQAIYSAEGPAPAAQISPGAGNPDHLYLNIQAHQQTDPAPPGAPSGGFWDGIHYVDPSGIRWATTAAGGIPPEAVFTPEAVLSADQATYPQPTGTIERWTGSIPTWVLVAGGVGAAGLVAYALMKKGRRR